MSERKTVGHKALRRVKVKHNLVIAPRMRRIVFAGADLSDFEVQAPAQWVKMFFPSTDRTGFSGRAYTIRSFNRITQELMIDFFLHEGGIVSSWVAEAKPGSEIEFGDPRSEFRINPNADSYLLAGDETAIPGIMALLECIPQNAKVAAYIEVTDGDDELAVESTAHVDLHWLHRTSARKGTTTLLVDVLRNETLQSGGCQAWLAGEVTAVHAVRQLLLQNKGWDRSAMHTCGYWKLGESSHRDPTGDR